jgi:transposase
MVMYAKIRRMFFREHLSISEIARRTTLTRNTIKKWLKAADSSEPKYRRPPKLTKLTPFEPKLLMALVADAHRPKRDQRNALMLFKEIQQDGFTGCYSRVTQFVRSWRNQSSAASTKSAFVPLHFALGEAFQFDWSEEWLVIGGIHRKILAAHTKLCASRAFMICAYPTQSHEMLFDAHTRAFTALGGIAKRGIYDNMKTAVDKVQKGKGRIVNTRFFAMTAHYLFDPDFCNVASGWEKGVVEKNVQDSRRRVWSEARKQKFSSFGELNAWLETHCRALWATLPHPDYASLTIADVLEQEQLYMMPMPTPFDGYTEVLARVSSTCLVTVQRNRYSVPCHLANSKVAVHLYPECMTIYAENTMVASHIRLYERDQTRYDWQHYIPLIDRKPGALRNGAPFAEMPLPLLKLQSELRRRERLMGDRIMATVLANVPVHGLEAVLIAVEQVLSSGAPSAEHILNVLTRLKPPKIPAQVATNLTLLEEPLANTARYDSLNTTKEINHA